MKTLPPNTSQLPPNRMTCSPSPNTRTHSPKWKTLHYCNSTFKNLFHSAALYHRYLVVYCENCTCNLHSKPLDGGIEAQPNGAVETVPLNTQLILLHKQAYLLPASIAKQLSWCTLLCQAIAFRTSVDQFLVPCQLLHPFSDESVVLTISDLS